MKGGGREREREREMAFRLNGRRHKLSDAEDVGAGGGSARAGDPRPARPLASGLQRTDWTRGAPVHCNASSAHETLFSF